MNIERKSPFTGKVHTMDLDITEEQIADYESGKLLQHAFPHLTAEEREFYKTGITPEEWDSMFPPEEEEEDADFDPDIYENDDQDLDWSEYGEGREPGWDSIS